ncbi:hypothetical protein OF83DRAFT_36920 [Amylostereum chailletii]|nr:hypothetical protein OF83DRAFT_36920 [Amylostereum chailletii]
MPPTSLIHKQPQSMCAKPDPSRFQDLDDTMFVREATVQDDEDAVAIDQTIVNLFSHIPALIAHDRAVMRDIHDKRTRGWTPLRVITRGKGRLGRLQPLDEILPVTLQSLLRASSNTNIRNIKGYPNILFIGISSGGQDIPYSGTSALDLAREDDDEDSSSDESRSGGNMGDGDVEDVGSNSDKKAEDGTAPNDDDKLSESSDPPAAFNETPSYDTSHSDSLDLDEIDPGTVDNEFSHGSSTLPRSHVLLIRSLHNMHAPSEPGIWWPLNAPTSNEFSSAIKACDYLDFTIEFWSGPAMNTADVWTKAGEGLIKSLDFIRILDLRLLDLQLLISEVGDDERGHILEAILPEIAFGEYGLGRIVPSLSILYQLVASLPPSMATLQAERRVRLLRFSMALRRLVLCFKENTSRTLYDPLSFRLLGLEIEKAMKGKKLFNNGNVSSSPNCRSVLHLQKR